MRSVEGLLHHLGNEFDFRVVACDRDSGDAQPYPNIQPGVWKDASAGQVWYLPKSNRCLRAMIKVLRNEEHDLLFMQSLFNPCFTLWPLILRRFGLSGSTRMLLAPRGELSAGALSIKPFRKRLFLRLAKMLGLFRGVQWQATSAEEVEEIRGSGLATAIRGKKRPDVYLAPNLRKHQAEEKEVDAAGDGRLRVVFLSRIAPKKNLDYALQVLAKVTVLVVFDIYGPIDRTPDYWIKCQELIKQFPANVSVNYHGPIEPNDVPGMFHRHDLLFLPTRGENFGHVIIESLLSGCPVLISDRTPWRGLSGRKAGWDLSLDYPVQFVSALEEYSRTESKERCEMRRAARLAGKEFLDLDAAIVANQNMFRQIFADLETNQ